MNGEVEYEVTLVTERQPSDQELVSGCDSTYKFLWNEYVVWGGGWAGGDWGKTLRDQVDDCALLPDTWSFEYCTGDDGREWTAKFRTGIFQKKCVASATEEAGGVKGCSGSG